MVRSAICFSDRPLYTKGDATADSILDIGEH